MNSNSSSIPVIDFASFVNGTDEDRLRTSSSIDEACRQTGFFYLINHGVDEKLIERVYSQSKRFFSQSIDEKMKLFIGSSAHGNNRGYTPLFEEKLSAKGDLKEAFDLALELPADDIDRLERSASLYGPNVWPENLPGLTDRKRLVVSSLFRLFVPGFRQCIYDEFYLAMKKLGFALLEAFSMSLNLSKDYFTKLFEKPMMTMRILRYPPQIDVVDDEQLGCGAHTDYECFTILSQSNDKKALQILNTQDEWVDVVPLDNCFVVNIGDMLQRWTNDRFKSTVHRVINRNDEERYSVAVFFGPNYWTEVRPISTDDERLGRSTSFDKYPPVVAGHYLNKRFDETYQYRADQKNKRIDQSE